MGEAVSLRRMTQSAPLPRWQALALIAALSLIWGYNWVMMKVAVTYAPPFAFAALRFLGGAVVLMATLKLMGRSLRFRELAPRWRVITLIGLLQTAFCFGLITWALSTGTAGRSAVLNYTMPLWVLVFSVLLLKEKVPGAQWGAAALALVGIVLISIAGGKSGSLPAVMLALGAGLTWGLGVVVTKRAMRVAPMDPLALTAWQMLAGAIAMCAVALIVPEGPIDWSPGFITALLYNIGPATPLAYVIWFTLLNRLDAGLASLGILLTPLLGLLLSTLQLGERPGLVEGVGMGLILLAIAGLGWVSGRQARKNRPA
ncbi:DMT family transporter [Dongia rigui]|uniref:DMT family transporter n=1 Tax=Dongia rigui TaxID=940149 RepID=A0ABU5DVY2_9PROT|nr:DMT family transporter [Dongia rigui]MDY0871434.1 DMT family transporter [Dongia rigui]